MKRERIRSFWNKPSHAAYLFIAPAGILLFVFCIIPLMASLVISTFKMGVDFHSADFIAFDNYVKIFKDRQFINSFWVTLKFSLIETPLQMLIGIIISAIIAKNNFFHRCVRSIYFLPVITSAVTVGIMWQMLLHSNVGLFTWWLQILGFGKINLLNDPNTALYAVIGVSLWRSFGISTIILVSAIQNVPIDYYEAAELDGASKIRQFFSITLPDIMPAVWFLLMTRIIGSLQVFDIIYTLTNGGPNKSTNTLVLYVYTQAFTKNNNMGYATAISEVLFIMILIATVIQQCVMKRTSD